MTFATAVYWGTCVFCEDGKPLVWKVNGSDECRESPYQPNVFRGCERKLIIDGGAVRSVHLGPEQLELDPPRKRPSANWFRRSIPSDLNEIWKVFSAACGSEGWKYEEIEDCWLAYRRYFADTLQIHYTELQCEQLLALLRNEKENKDE